jgi:hypothetical protein
MIGIAFHAPSLVSLMVDREKFTTVVVPSAFDGEAQDELETLFAKKIRKGTRRLLLVDGTETLGKIAALFPEAKARIIVFDVFDKLANVTDLVVDVTKGDPSRLVSIKPDSLNPALVKMRPATLEDYRHNFEGGKVDIALRDGRFADVLKGAPDSFKKVSVKYLLGLSTRATMKRSGRQDKPRVSTVQNYVDSEAGVNVTYAFMDIALYGTEDKTAALFASADLEDLRLAVSFVDPDADLQFKFEVPDKLKLARE